MRYISLFSGIEAATVAAEGLGWVSVCFAEIDPFPSAVLKEHYPDVPNVGDVSKANWSRYKGKCDLIVGGSPCQSFSIAGKRDGLNGASGLMWEYVRAIREIRPQWIIWENVPGALSSSGGEDFRCLLSALDDLGYGLAWRILDAQFFGVPQRRRRVFLVGHFGAEPPAEVLFEPESLRGDLDTSAEKRQALTTRAGSSAEGASRGVMSRTLLVRCGCDGGGKGALVSDEVSLTLSTSNVQTLFDNRGDAMIVRKLTPMECERLQGFPDGYTKIPYRGKPAEDCPDAPRYKALGNSMAVPVMRWIFERLDAVSKGQCTVADDDWECK